MQALLNFFSYSFLLFLGAAFYLSLLSAPLPFFCLFFLCSRKCRRKYYSSNTKACTSAQQKLLLSSSKEKTYGSATYYQNMQGPASTTQIRRNNLMKYFLRCYAWCPCQKMRTPKLDSNILFQKLQTRIVLCWPNTVNMRTRTVKQDLILKARTRLRHDKHNDTREGLKFRKVIRKEKLQRHQWVIGQQKQFF